MRFWVDVGYHDYQVITEDRGEREAIARNLGDRNVLLMRNHGVVTVGKSVRDAFMRMREIEAACDIQLRQQAAGVTFTMPPTEVLDHAAEQRKSHDSGRGTADWPAWLRRLDRIKPSQRGGRFNPTPGRRGGGGKG